MKRIVMGVVVGLCLGAAVSPAYGASPLRLTIKEARHAMHTEGERRMADTYTDSVSLGYSLLDCVRLAPRRFHCSMREFSLFDTGGDEMDYARMDYRYLVLKRHHVLVRLDDPNWGGR